jgi:hypothetical protein
LRSPGNPLARLLVEERAKPTFTLHIGAEIAQLVQSDLGTIGQLFDDSVAGYPVLRALPKMDRQSILVLKQRLKALSSFVLDDGSVDWVGFEHRCDLDPVKGESDLNERPAGDRGPSVSVPKPGTRTTKPTTSKQARSALKRGRNSATGPSPGPRDPDKVSHSWSKSSTSSPTVRSPPSWSGSIRALFDRLISGKPARAAGNSVAQPLPEAAPARPVEVRKLGTKAGLLNDAGRQALEDLSAALRIPEAARERPVEVLRLGITKAGLLHDAGLHTLGDLSAEGTALRLYSLPGIGLKTVRLISERLAALKQSGAQADDEPDWDDVAERWGFRPAPAAPVAGSDAFLAALPEVIAAVIESHDSGMDRLILSERISRPRGEQMTLDAIGTAFNVTRERVRQRQVRLLDNLSDALINDDQSGMPVHFRESFRAFWVRAAQHFSGVSELAYPDFEGGLERAWGISARELTPFLPLAIAILADGVRMPRLHPALLGVLPENVLGRPLHDFPVRRSRGALLEAGLTHFGLLLEAARNDRLPPGRAGQVALEVLNGVGRALAGGPPGDIDAWAGGLGLVALPRLDPRDGASFLDCLDGALAAAAETDARAGRAAQIYRLRTCVPRRRRPTLQDIAVTLSTHGPSVKREESLLLAGLHAQLVKGDMTDAGVVWRPGFVTRFTEAVDVHEHAGGDYNRFCSALARTWNLESEDVRERAEGLWAVLTLYPGGRRAMHLRNGMRRTPDDRPAVAIPHPPAAGVVVLRGFRRAH